MPSGNNTKTKLESLGDVEFKYVSYRDTIEFADLSQKQLSDRRFVVQILFHQLIKPRIDVDNFQKLSDKELIELSRAFVKKENHIFKYFHDTGEFFKDFKRAIATGHEKDIEELKKSVQQTLSAFTKSYASVIQQAVDGTSYRRESLQALASVAKQIGNTQRRLAEFVNPGIEECQSIARIITASLRPQIDFWQQWTEQNKNIFDSFSHYWAESQQRYNIAEAKAVKVLRKYKWFITPSFPVPFIFEVVTLDRKKARQDKAVNKLFVEYFESNNWRNLEIMVSNWKNTPLLKKRHKILADCTEMAKSTSKKRINEANVVLPTLITQIDGVLSDYLNSKNISWHCDYDDRIDQKTGKVKKAGRKTQFKNTRSNILPTKLDDLANDIFLNILFQSSHKGKPLITPFNFNRHKIIHGESVKYGRKGYLIRAFMVLDFLAHLE